MLKLPSAFEKRWHSEPHNPDPKHLEILDSGSGQYIMNTDGSAALRTSSDVDTDPVVCETLDIFGSESEIVFPDSNLCGSRIDRITCGQVCR
jgi:hypothetical protein